MIAIDDYSENSFIGIVLTLNLRKSAVE